MSEKSGDFGSREFLSFVSKHWKVILFLIVLIFAFYFRAYHIDYPVTGYHNWKETHYLTEARNFADNGFFEHGFFVPEWDYPSINENPSGAHTDSFPTTSIIVGFLFNLLRVSLSGARLVSILFSIGSIILFYLIVKLLFKREDLAFISALVFALNPLAIFFGRQVQLLGPALFFSLAGIYYYIKWFKERSWKNTVLFSIFLMLGIMTKYSFILFAVPVILTYPYKILRDKKYLSKHLFFVFIGLLSFLWFKYSSSISKSIGSQFEVVEFGVLFNSDFWRIMLSFARDNYTLLGLTFFVFGILFWFFIVKVNMKSFECKFINSYLIGSVIWFVFMAQKMQGHNYHQYPLLPLFVFFVSFFILSASMTLAKVIKFKKLKWIFVFIIFSLLILPSFAAKDRMFDTQFEGLDVAGEYIKEHKLEGERVMHSSHQAYGLLWHGDIKGTRGIPSTVEDIQFAEDNLNASWIFVYAWDFGIFQDDRVEYISQNYKLAQIGFNMQGDQFSPVYLLFRKGGTFDFSSINLLVSARLDAGEFEIKEYEFSDGRMHELYYVNLE